MPSLAPLGMVGIAGRHRKGRGPVKTDLREPRPRLTAWLATFSAGERQVGCARTILVFLARFWRAFVPFEECAGFDAQRMILD